MIKLYKKMMLSWLLIISITMVSTTMLAFVSAYIAIIPQIEQYFNRDRTYILLLSNTFNILYLIITPLIFSSLKKRYSILVIISVILTAIGCVGRFMSFNNYVLALIMSSLVAIGHIPIITAPYGLLDLFPEKQKGYAASIPLFVPTLGINFSILYSMAYIVNDSQSQPQQNINNQVDNLNFIIAVVGLVSCVLTILCMILLKKQIRIINEDDEKSKNKLPFFKQLRQQFKGGKLFFLMLCCWGTILGLNWTYGGMFGVFFSDGELSNKDIALIGLYANLSSVLLSNLGNWISTHTRFSNKHIIFALNVTGLAASIMVHALTSFQQNLLNRKHALIVAIIILRGGFSSFVSLALIQLSHCGPSVLISGIFFYIANASNLGGNYIVDLLPSKYSLAIMSLIIFVCIGVVSLAYARLPLQKVDEGHEKTYKYLSKDYTYMKQSTQYQIEPKKTEVTSQTQVKS